MITFEVHDTDSFYSQAESDQLQPELLRVQSAILEKTGKGSDFLGWLDLVRQPDDALLAGIDKTAQEIRSRADVFLCIGIGGSYLGAKAVIEALSSGFETTGPEIIFAGHHMGPSYIPALLDYLEGKSVFVNVVSKSGTTLEPALAFRFVFDWMRHRFEDLADRIVVTTDRERGALNELHRELGLKKYVIPDDVGGRFSVLTPVGLLPIAVAGYDIRSLLYGAVQEARLLSHPDKNAALAYAAHRYLLYQGGCHVEALASFEPRLFGMGAWWQQLFGESEGKDGKGLLPIRLEYSTDLHSLGQYVQDGQRILCETFLTTAQDGGPTVASDDKNLDGLNYLSGKTIGAINRKAYEGTLAAHAEGGVPTATVQMPAISTESIGALIYFFEHAVAAGGYLLDVNPFDQPGVEAYKKEMFKKLGKPGT